jgi:ABC-2 type transport system ATP-binding protein
MNAQAISSHWFAFVFNRSRYTIRALRAYGIPVTLAGISVASFVYLSIENQEMMKEKTEMSLPDESGAVVACTNLTKIYEGGTTALKDLTLSIKQGMSFGLLGENGAGKSTLVRLIMGFIRPTRGELLVLGQRKVSRAHPRIGYLHERPYIELRFTARKYLSYMAQISGLWGNLNSRRVDEALELVDLSAASDEMLATYSKGMQQRLCIAQALLTDPEFLILDEPTSGLDPYSQWKVRQIIAELRGQGKTLLICSHYLAEVETLCDTVGILQRGRLIRSGAVEELIHIQDTIEILLRNDQVASEIVERLHIDKHVLEMERNLLRIRAEAQQEVLAALVLAEVPIQALNPLSQTLEEVYIQTTRAGVESRPLASTLAVTALKKKGSE